MLSIIASQITRFKKLIIGLAVLQFIFIQFVVNVQWLMEAFVGIYHIVLVANVVFGAGLGWFQMHTLTKTNRWAFMVHRPMSRPKLFGGFALGAFGVFCLATLLPVLASFVVVDLSNHGALDWRLYLILPALAGVMMCCYFASVFSVLSSSKLAPFIFVLPALLITNKAHGLWVFLTVFVILLWLIYICYNAFKPALDAPVKSPVAEAMIVLPLQYVLSIMLAYVFNWVFQMGVILVDPQHTGNWSAYWKPDSFHFAEQMTDRELLDYGFKHSQLNAADFGVNDTSNIGFDLFEVDWYKPHTRHQLLYADRAFAMVGKIRQKSEGINWYFNHGEMLFFGIHDRTAQFKGWMDNSGQVHQTKQSVSAAQRFEDIPRTKDDQNIYVGSSVYHYDRTNTKRKTLLNTFSLDDGESFVSSIKPLQKRFGVLSNQHLYLLKSGDNDQLETIAKIPLNAQISNLSRVSSAFVDGRYFISILTGNEQRYNYQDAQHAFYQVDEKSGETTLLHTQKLAQNWPDIYRYRQLILSPALKYLHDVTWSTIKPYHNLELNLNRILTQPIPANVLWLTLLLSILVMAITSWVVRPLAWSDRRKFCWIIVTGLTGIAGLISLFFVNQIHKPPKTNSS